MKASGIIRKVDQLGRIVIPKEIRNSLSINIQDPLEIIQVGDEIVIRHPRVYCALCGNTDNISPLGDKYICTDCVQAIRQKFNL